jgi:peptide/nickel transport system substrate-binding protein
MSIRQHQRRTHIAVAAALALLMTCMVGLVANAGASPRQARPAHHAVLAHVSGGTASFAELPGTPPNYIFPLEQLQYYAFNNIEFLQYLLWRPLYMYGVGTSPVLNQPLSLAYPPVFTNGDATVTITLKPYRWSDGSPVTTADVAFWQNLVKANKANWADYTPGYYPDNIVSMNILSSTKIVFHLTHGVSPVWFTANELGQITPLPVQTMDKISPTSPVKRYDETPAGAVKVWNFLNSQSKILTTFATNPVWKVVDGPWKLQSFSVTGRAVFVPNPKYSGPVKPSLSQFVELPFTSDAAELDALRSGAVSVGYLPYEDLPQKGSLTSAGYTFTPWWAFYFNYFAVNAHNPTVGPIFSQTYVRQAMQMLINQAGVIRAFYGGIANPTCGPAPLTAGDPYASSYEKSCPFSYNPSKAVKLLQSHGWKVVPNGVSYCNNPGTGSSQCGAGIQKGAKMQFKFVYANTSVPLAESVQTYKSEAEAAGIQYNLSTESFGAVSGLAVPCTASQSTCSWQIGDWGLGWLYQPDYYPTGETQFALGAGGDTSNYVNTKANSLVLATTHPGATPATYTTYENYITQQVPFMWQPANPYEVSEIKSNLHGVAPENIYYNIFPEDWYYTK